MKNYIQHHTRNNLIVGGLSWFALLIVSLNQWSYLAQIHLLILFGIAILTPLSLRLVIPISRHDTIHFLSHVILRIQPIIPILTVIAFVMPQGESQRINCAWLAGAVGVDCAVGVCALGRSYHTHIGRVVH